MTRPRATRLLWALVAFGIPAVQVLTNQTADVTHPHPFPGLWIRWWVAVPAMIVALVLATDVPRRVPKSVVTIGTAISLLVILFTPQLVDAAVEQYLLTPHQATVVTSQNLKRGVRLVEVELADRTRVQALTQANQTLPSYDPDAPPGQRRIDPVVYGSDRDLDAGERVEVRVDPAGVLYPRIKAAKGQPGYAWFFDRSAATIGGSTAVLLAGWGYLLAATAMAIARPWELSESRLTSKGRRSGGSKSIKDSTQ